MEIYSAMGFWYFIISLVIIRVTITMQKKSLVFVKILQPKKQIIYKRQIRDTLLQNREQIKNIIILKKYC